MRNGSVVSWLSVSLGLLLGGCCSGPDNLGVASEQSGLSSTIERIDRRAADVELVYTLTWTGQAPMWDLKGLEPVLVSFQDSAGHDLPSPTEPIFIMIDKAFLELDAKRSTSTLTTAVPESACTLSLALGRSGLVTPRVRIP